MSDGDRFAVVPEATMSTYDGRRRRGGGLAIPCVLAMRLDADFWHRYVSVMQAEHASHWGTA